MRKVYFYNFYIWEHGVAFHLVKRKKKLMCNMSSVPFLNLFQDTLCTTMDRIFSLLNFLTSYCQHAEPLLANVFMPYLATLMQTFNSSTNIFNLLLRFLRWTMKTSSKHDHVPCLLETCIVACVFLSCLIASSKTLRSVWERGRLSRLLPKWNGSLHCHPTLGFSLKDRWFTELRKNQSTPNRPKHFFSSE